MVSFDSIRYELAEDDFNELVSELSASTLRYLTKALTASSFDSDNVERVYLSLVTENIKRISQLTGDDALDLYVTAKRSALEILRADK